MQFQTEFGFCYNLNMERNGKENTVPHPLELFVKHMVENGTLKSHRTDLTYIDYVHLNDILQFKGWRIPNTLMDSDENKYDQLYPIKLGNFPNMRILTIDSEATFEFMVEYYTTHDRNAPLKSIVKYLKENQLDERVSRFLHNTNILPWFTNKNIYKTVYTLSSKEWGMTTYINREVPALVRT